MAVSLGEGLMAAATAFTEAFGGTVLKNIDESNKQDRAYVLQQAATMRDRITKGRAKEAKLKNTLRARYNQLGVLKGITDEERLAMITNEGIFAQVQKKISEDAQLPPERRGIWYKTRPESKYIDPYAPRSEAERMGIDELMKKAFVPYTLPDADKDDEKMARDDILNAMFGGGQSPERLLAQAEKRAVSQRGLGTVSGSELDLYSARGGLAEDRVARGEMAPIAFQSTRVTTPFAGSVPLQVQKRTLNAITALGFPDVSNKVDKMAQVAIQAPEYKDAGIDIDSAEYNKAAENRNTLLTGYDKATVLQNRIGKGEVKNAIAKYRASLSPTENFVLDMYIRYRNVVQGPAETVVDVGTLNARLDALIAGYQRRQAGDQ